MCARLGPPRRGGEHPGDPARPSRRVHDDAGDRGLDPGQDRDRDPAPGTHRGARGAGAVRDRAEGLERDAAQAEPGRLRAHQRAGAGRPGARPGGARERRARGTSATSRTRRPSASSCPTPRACWISCSPTLAWVMDGLDRVPRRDARERDEPRRDRVQPVGAAGAGRSRLVARGRLSRRAGSGRRGVGRGRRASASALEGRPAWSARRSGDDGARDAVRSAAVPAQPRRRCSMRWRSCRSRRARRRDHGRRPARPGQGARRVRRRDRARCSSSPPIASARSTSCCPTPSPTRDGCSPASSLFWFERTERPGRRTTFATRRPVGVPARRSPTTRPGGPRDRWCERADVIPVECVARGFLSGSGWAQYRRRRLGVRRGAARRAFGSPTGCPSRSSRPPRRPQKGHDLPLTLERDRRPGRPGARRAAAGAHRRHLRADRRGGRCERGIIVADTKLEFGFAGRRAAPDRRGGHARLSPLLARRRLRAGARAAELRQAVRA